MIKLLFIIEIKNIGAIFCHVRKIKQFIQFIFMITLGIHQCNGDTPSFIKILIWIKLNLKFILK